MRNFLESQFIKDVKSLVNRFALFLVALLALIGFLHVAEIYPNASYTALTFIVFIVVAANRPSKRK